MTNPPQNSDDLKKQLQHVMGFCMYEGDEQGKCSHIPAMDSDETEELQQVFALIDQKVREARIEELENWTYCGADKWEIDARIEELNKAKGKK